MHVYVYICMYVYIHIYIYIYIHMYVCMCIYIYIYTHTCTYIYIDRYILFISGPDHPRRGAPAAVPLWLHGRGLPRAHEPEELRGLW